MTLGREIEKDLVMKMNEKRVGLSSAGEEFELPSIEEVHIWAKDRLREGNEDKSGDAAMGEEEGKKQDYEEGDCGGGRSCTRRTVDAKLGKGTKLGAICLRSERLGVGMSFVLDEYLVELTEDGWQK